MPKKLKAYCNIHADKLLYMVIGETWYLFSDLVGVQSVLFWSLQFFSAAPPTLNLIDQRSRRPFTDDNYSFIRYIHLNHGIGFLCQQRSH